MVATVVHVCRAKKCYQSKMKVCIAAGEHVKPVMSILDCMRRVEKLSMAKLRKEASSETCRRILSNSMTC